MIKFTLFFAVALFAAVGVNYLTSDDAMTKCQLTHSYDTCFQILNR